jgi:hypothetical protein
VAKKYYWTITDEAKPRYHDNQDCPEGLKIEPEIRRDDDYYPAGRTHCEVCLSGGPRRFNAPL